MTQAECVSCLVPVCMMQIGMYPASEILCERPCHQRILCLRNYSSQSVIMVRESVRFSVDMRKTMAVSESELIPPPRSRIAWDAETRAIWSRTWVLWLTWLNRRATSWEVFHQSIPRLAPEASVPVIFSRKWDSPAVRSNKKESHQICFLVTGPWYRVPSSSRQTHATKIILN